MFSKESPIGIIDSGIGGFSVARKVQKLLPRENLVYLGDGVTGFELELTWLKDRTEAYDLGEGEFHLAFVTDEFDVWHTKHREMGCICFENPAMGIYFIEDPDGYWIEIIPDRKPKP